MATGKGGPMVQWEVPRTPTGALLALRFAEEYGVAADAALRGTGLTPEMLSDPDQEVLASQELGIIRNLVEVTGGPAGLGIEAGARFRLSAYGIWGFALVSSPTLRSAVDVAFRFMDLAFPFATIERRITGTALEFVLTAPDIEPALRRFVLEREAAAIRVIEQDLLGEEFGPNAVSFAFPEPPADVVASYARTFGVRPSFEARETVLTLDAALLDTPLPQANEVTMAMALDQCRDLLERRRSRSGFSGEVRDLLLAHLAESPDACRVAHALHMSERTLRHRLAAEGTNFRALLNEVRERLAEELLRGGLPVSEVSVRLGYAEVSSFSQAFRRWKGTGPREYRSSLRRARPRGLRV